MDYFTDVLATFLDLGTLQLCCCCGGRSKRQTQWVWRQASERLLLNRNNKIKCPKGMKCPKETGDLVSSLCCAGCEGGAVFWKEGSR